LKRSRQVHLAPYRAEEIIFGAWEEWPGRAHQN
jgi:hypothetical protein